MNPMVSVVVTTYRRDGDLKRALMSLADQTYDNYEVILVDDNGDAIWNEKVKGIVDDVVGTTGLNINLIVNNPNKGAGESRNTGIFASKGEYITFLDDDDVYLPEKIEKQVTFMHKENGDFCITDLILYDDNDRQTDKRIRDYIKSYDKNSLYRYNAMYQLTGNDTFMFKAEFIKRIGGFDPIDVGDDFYMALKAIDNDCKFVYLNRCDIKAYVHGNNGGISTGSKRIAGEMQIWKKKLEYSYTMSKADIRYINMRHYALLTVLYKKAGKLDKAVANLFKAFFTSPSGCVELLIRHKTK